MTPAEQLAERTADAYAIKLYASWRACCEALLLRGYTPAQAESLLRSKVPRWAADHSNARYGRATSVDLLRFIDTTTGATKDLIAEILAEAAP